MVGEGMESRPVPAPASRAVFVSAVCLPTSLPLPAFFGRHAADSEGRAAQLSMRGVLMLRVGEESEAEKRCGKVRRPIPRIYTVQARRACSWRYEAHPYM